LLDNDAVIADLRDTLCPFGAVASGAYWEIFEQRTRRARIRKSYLGTLPAVTASRRSAAPKRE